MLDTYPARITLARHETFHLRDGWVPKALHSLDDDPLSLTGADAHHELGVGKNMLASIRYWINASGLAEPTPSASRTQTEYRLTELGRLILEHDPYFEDRRSLWLWHSALVCNREGATFWYWLFMELDYAELSEQQLLADFTAYVVQCGQDVPTKSSIKKDLNCLLRMYSNDRSALSTDETASPLASLGLIQPSLHSGRFRLNYESDRRVPAAIVAYLTHRFMEDYRPQQTTVSLEELRWAPCSPGRILCLDSRGILDALERQREQGWFELTQTAGLRTLHLNGSSSKDLLERIYDD